MTKRRSSTCQRLLVLVVLVVLADRPAPAQVTPDPYSPWNSVYRPFVFPNTYSSPSIPNQARLPYLANEGASPYGGSYFESMNGFDANLFDGSARMGGRGVPYYQTFRSQRAAAAAEDVGLYERQYIPNANDTFYEDQAARQQRLIDARKVRNPRELDRARFEQGRFFQALRQRDPERRSRMLGALEAARNESTSRAAALPPAGSSDGQGGGVRLRAPGAGSLESVPLPGSDSRMPPASGLNLLRPLAPVTVAPPRSDSMTGSGTTNLPRRAVAPEALYPVPPEVETLLQPPGGPIGDRIPGFPPAPEPR